VAVHAAGPWTAALAASIGVHLPITPARNAMLVSEPVPPMIDAFVSSHELAVYLRQARKGQLHVGGVFTVGGTFDQRVSAPEIGQLAKAVEILPALGKLRILRSWAGTLDLTPDHLPVLGKPAAVEGYVVAAGFSGHGFCLAPAAGRAICGLAQPVGSGTVRSRPGRRAYRGVVRRAAGRPAHRRLPQQPRGLGARPR
jgi:sarcosine oxidase subunit beta